MYAASEAIPKVATPSEARGKQSKTEIASSANMPTGPPRNDA